LFCTYRKISVAIAVVICRFHPVVIFNIVEFLQSGFTFCRLAHVGCALHDLLLFTCRDSWVACSLF